MRIRSAWIVAVFCAGLCAGWCVALPVWAGLCDEPLRTIQAKQRQLTLDDAIAKTIVEEAGCRLDLRSLGTTTARRLAMLRDGQIDLVAGASATPERGQYAWFSDAYRREIVRLYFHADLPRERHVQQVAALANSPLRVVAPRQAWFGEEFEVVREKLLAEKRLTLLPSLSAAVTFFNAQPARVEVLVADEAGLLLAAAAQAPLKHSGDRVIDDNGVHLLLSRRTVSPAQVEAFNAAIQRMQASGRLQRMLEDWGVAELARAVDKPVDANQR